MIFYGINKDSIKYSSENLGDFYKFSLGNKVEVTSLKKKHVNSILSKNLSSQSKEDKLMVRYYPTNEIYFKKDFIESSNCKIFSSCFVSKDTCSVFVGNTEDYSINSGILVLSSALSLNNMIEKERLIYCNSQKEDYVRNNVKVLACGIRDDKLLALYYIPSERGLAISCDSGGMCISAKSLSFRNCDSWSRFSLEDWFEGVKIKEL